jgi:hypothetical protein
MRGPLLAAFVAASAAGCLRSPDPLTFTEDAVSIHGVLRASDTEARLWLQHSTPAGPVGVAGATLSLESGGTAVALAQVTEAQAAGCLTNAFGSPPANALEGCFGGSLPEPVAPGSRWTLRATVPGYGVVTGATTIPALPQVDEPAANSRYTLPPPHDYSRVTQVPVAWSAPGAVRVEIALGDGVAYRDGAVVEGAVCTAWADGGRGVHDRSSGTVTLRVHGVGCGDRNGMVVWDSAAVRLMVTSYDSAYAEYALRGSSTSRGRGGRGLEGAYGVFGAAATAHRRLVFVPTP